MKQAFALSTALSSIDIALNKDNSSIPLDASEINRRACDRNNSFLKSDRFFKEIRNKNFEALMPKNEQTNQEKQTQEKTQKQEPIKHEEKRVSKSSMRR